MEVNCQFTGTCKAIDEAEDPVEKVFAADTLRFRRHYPELLINLIKNVQEPFLRQEQSISSSQENRTPESNGFSEEFFD